MAWEVEGTDEFQAWFDGLTEQERRSAVAVVDLLEMFGTSLGFPFSSSIFGSRYSHMRELRVQSGGRPLRILYAFDPRRTAILLLGGDKTGNERWYDAHIPLAERLSDEYLEELRREGLI